MKPIRKFSISVILIVLVFHLSVTAFAIDQEEPMGDPLVGGLLYSAWDVVAGYELPLENHPLWYDDTIIEITSWRCATCHGWDYSGRSEISSSNPEEIIDYPALFSVMGDPREEVIAWLDGSNNHKHDFSHFLTEKDLDDLSAFLISGLVTPDRIAEVDTGNVRGTSSYGEDLFKSKCRECHGSDGARINFGSANQPFFIGNISVDNPWRVAHIIHYGHVYTKVLPGASFGWSFNDEIDLLTYLQRLPLARLNKEEVVEVLDYTEQADTLSLVYAAVGITVIILGGVLLSSRRVKENP